MWSLYYTSSSASELYVLFICQWTTGTTRHMHISFKKVATLTGSCHLNNPLAFVYQTICLWQQFEQIGEHCPRQIVCLGAYA